MKNYKEKINDELRKQRVKKMQIFSIILILIILLCSFYYFEFYKTTGKTEQLIGAVTKYQAVDMGRKGGPQMGYLFIRLSNGESIILTVPLYMAPEKDSKVNVNLTTSFLLKRKIYSFGQKIKDF